MKNIAAAMAFTVCALFPLTSGYAQAQKPTTTKAAVQPKSDPAQDAKVQALQAEIQVMKDFIQHILATVYFALATVVVVLIAMIGFGWYQNFRVFERDKQALRQDLLNTLKEETGKGFEELNGKATERFKAFDENIAKALERTHQRLSDVQLMMETSIFHATHTPKTPRTDFMLFNTQIDRSIGHVTSGVLDYALSIALDHVQRSAQVDALTRTSLLKMAGKVAAQNPVFGERLREILAGKSE